MWLEEFIKEQRRRLKEFELEWLQQRHPVNLPREDWIHHFAVFDKEANENEIEIEKLSTRKGT